MPIKQLNTKNLICPTCGEKGKFENTHPYDIQSTILICKNCGTKKTPEAMQNKSEEIKSNPEQLIFADSGIANTDLPSGKPEKENDPIFVNVNKKRRLRRPTWGQDEERLKHTDPEEVRRVSHNMFNLSKGSKTFNLSKMTKRAQESPMTTPAADIYALKVIDKQGNTQFVPVSGVEDPETLANEYRGMGYQAEIETLDKVPLDIAEAILQGKTYGQLGQATAANGPFNLKKFAREWDYTEQQKKRTLERKKIFPQGKPDEKMGENDKEGSEGKDGGKNKAMNANDPRRFDVVDREDARTPNPEDFIPGYKEWKDKEVDKYYDGWLEHHIENSGGKIIGSNTEKIQNLNDGEKYHAPVFPDEAPMEKLLETRHEYDDDYERKVAGNEDVIVTAQAKKIISAQSFESEKK